MEAIGELMQFLDISSRIDLKTVALESVVGITSNAEQFPVETWQQIFPLLIKIAYEDISEPLKKDAALALINLSANQEVAKGMLNHGDHSKRLVNCLWKMIVECAYPSADPACMILCNLTIEKVGCDKVYNFMKVNGITMKDVVDQLCVEEKSDDEKKPKLHYLGPLLSNLSQLLDAREELLANGCSLLGRLLPFTEYLGSAVRRGGAIGAIRNCCFDVSIHEMLLTKMDILSRLLLPLAGPTPDNFDEDEIEKLPIDLQYLDEGKKLEEDADIRKLLLEALVQLCATRKCREIIRDQNSYLILRELHKIETDKDVELACMNVIDILIKNEDEIKLDNYKDVDVPEDIQQKIRAEEEEEVLNSQN